MKKIFPLTTIVLIFFGCKIYEDNSPNPSFKKITVQIGTLDVVKEIPEQYEIFRKSIFYYDKKGNIVEALDFNIDEEIVFRTEYLYTNDNSIIEGKKYDNQGTLKFTYNYSYNKNNQVVEWHILNNIDSTKVYWEYVYDGQNISKKMLHEPNIIRVIKCKYDNYSNIIQENEYYGGWSVGYKDYTYKEFDKNDNWINRTILVFTLNGLFDLEEQRWIEYY